MGEELEITNKLPSGWAETTLENLAEQLFAGGDKPDKVSNERVGEFKYPIYANGIKDKGLYGFSNIYRVDKECVTVSARGTIGYSEVRNEKFVPIVRLIVIVPTVFTLSSYIKYFLENSIVGQSGSSIPQLTIPMIQTSLIKLPPINEQKRIVAKIEKLFSNLDNSDKYLAHLEKQLKRYRQSVLKSAFEGELTCEWRSINKFFLDDWQHKIIFDIADKIFAGGDKPDIVSAEQTEECPYPIYSNGLQADGLYGYTNIYKVEDECVTISARGTIGFPVVRNEKFVPIVRLIVVIPKNHVFPKYLKYYIQSKIVIQSGSSIPQLTVPMVKQIKISIPKLEEQTEIVKQIEKHFSIIDKLEAVVQQSIKESKRLRQSILKQAFEGKLVEQDPNDESAEVLLQKIAKAKEEYKKALKRKK